MVGVLLLLLLLLLLLGVVVNGSEGSCRAAHIHTVLLGRIGPTWLGDLIENTQGKTSLLLTLWVFRQYRIGTQ